MAEKALKEAILNDEADVEVKERNHFIKTSNDPKFRLLFILKAQLKLANHYLLTENLDTCNQLCNHMLKSVSNPSVEVLAVKFCFLNFKKISTTKKLISLF